MCLVCKLFADDTQLYLSKNDKFSDVLRITNTWCTASTARFNEGKTEVLPVGSEHHRAAVARTRSLQGTRDPTNTLPQGVRIVGNGEALRVLGGWVGHNVDTAAIWETAVTKMEEAAMKWSRRNLTMIGRKLIVNFAVLSRAQYLLMTNDPPPDTVKRICKTVREVMWHNKSKSIMRIEELQ
jgi:hypothetical protein